ncbi:hypothetical protein [uncultured Psychrosphaera sp.]|uniref:hypothetical protein n=1 Tax=uncultured Psychrosphaera sp. TaxID=1403522 RepID=UPI002624EE84|nr:hypothetical protein [uncultured Psychrosphaera sp.]
MGYYESVEKIKQEYPKLIDELATTYNLEQWGQVAKEVEDADKKILFELAERLWIKRMVNNQSLLMHPDAKAELVSRDFKLLAKHRKMVWANVLVNLEGADSIERFNQIKEKIIKKHSSIWWRDVYNKVKPTYAVKKRLEEINLGPSFSVAAANSSFFGGVASESRDDILRMIPNE